MQSRFPPTCAECGPHLCEPVDPLTRLMMDADDVSVSEIDALMQRVSRSLAKRSAGFGGVTE
jgi:predicted transcriptional regulator of viral defense system